MSALHELWNEAYIDEAFESEVVKAICEKVVYQREKSMFRITKRILKEIEVTDIKANERYQ